jgi:pilus assembly protein CpaF
MAESALISFWSDGPGARRRTVARALAQHWAERGQEVLVIEVVAAAEQGDVHDPAIWVPRFRSLAPVMLRNFLSASRGSYACLKLQRLPESALLKEFLSLVKQAYSWILFIGSRELSETVLPIMDASTRLLWVSANPDGFRGFLDQLTKFHFSHAFADAILSRVSGAAPPELPELIPGKRALALVPEDTNQGFHFQQTMHELAKVLEEKKVPPQPSRTDLSRKETSENMVEEVRRRVQPQLLKALEEKPHLEPAATQKTVEALLAEDASLPPSREARGEILSRVLDEVLGLGPLEPLLKDPAVSEIMVNGSKCLYIEKKGKLHPVDIQFSSEKQLRTVIDRIVAPIGRRVDESMPLCDARLADGSRVNIVLPPLALDGASITIRKFAARSIGFEDLVQFGSLSPAMASFLRQAVGGRKNVVVSGGTGSGKTTLLNALSSAIPEDERIVTIEDAAELRLQKPHVVRLESRPPNAEGEGAIPIRRLVMNALRMRPDRIVVGECRGGEALDMLQAMNTGHDGSMTTVHANSPRDALGRLETLVLMAGMDLPIRVVREQIRSAVHLIVQQARLADGSR